MTADEYVPSDEQVRTTFVEGASEDAYAMSWHEPYAEAYDRWLASHDARVRRDAAREALDGAEHRIARLEAQTSIRGRAVVMYRERAREAEERLKAVRDVLDQAWEEFDNVDASDIRRALEG